MINPLDIKKALQDITRSFTKHTVEIPLDEWRELLALVEVVCAERPKVYVVWLNDMTLGYFDSVEKANARIDAIKRQYPDNWKQLPSGRWVREYVMGSGHGSISRLEWVEVEVQ